MAGPSGRTDRATTALVAGAGVWAALLPVGGALVATDSGGVVVTTPGRRSHEIAPASQTLLQVDGARVIVLLALPFLAVAVVAGVLWWRRHRGRTGAGPVAWTVTGVIGAGALVGILTVGLFAVPVVLLLALACASRGPGERERGVGGLPT